MGNAAAAPRLTVVDAQELIRVQVDNLRAGMNAAGAPSAEDVREFADAAQFALMRLGELETRAHSGDAWSLFMQAKAIAFVLAEAEILVGRTGDDAGAREMWNSFQVLIDALDTIQHTGEALQPRPGVVV